MSSCACVHARVCNRVDVHILPSLCALDALDLTHKHAKFTQIEQIPIQHIRIVFFDLRN